MRHGNNVATPNGGRTALKLVLSFALMTVLLSSVVFNAAMNANAQNSTSLSSNSTNTASSLTEAQDGSSTSSSDAQSQDSSASPSNSTYYAGNTTQTSDEENKGNTTTSTITNSTATENESLPSDSIAGNLTETSGGLVKISGEPLAQSVTNSSITRSVTLPTLTFQGMADSQVTMTVTWNTDGSTEIKDSRGYKYVLSVPASEGAFSLWQNSTVVDQRVAGTEKQYDIFWRPVQNSGGYADRYEFFIAGTSANATTIKLAIDEGKNSIVQGNKLQVIRPTYSSDVNGSEGQQAINDLQNSTGITAAIDDQQEYEPEGLVLDWSDAISSGHHIEYDANTSSLTIPVAGGGKPFLIDPYVVGGTNTFISPEIGNYFDGQTRIVTTNGTRINAFYYDSSNIVYRTSDDKGKTWSSAISLGTGTVASDKHRWSVMRYIKDDVEHVTVIYWHVVGSDTNFYSKTGIVSWPSANISWDSSVLIDSTTVNSNCISASGSCVGVAAAADTDGNVYAAFKWVASGATYFSYEIMESSDGGDSWDDSLPEVTGVSIYRPALTITSLESGKMLFAYLKYDSANLFYRVYNGTSWSAEQTVTSTGMTSNTYKQISSTSTGQGLGQYVSYTNVTANVGGVLKVASFLANGTYQSVETADNTQRHNLPSIFSGPNGDLNILSISNGKVYDTRKSAGVWQTPFNPFGTNFTSLDQLTGAVVMNGMLSGLWRESTGSPYNVRFGLLENGIITTSATVQNSPNSSDYYEGERRVFSSSGNVLFAFYYDGSNIRYKTSVDGGNTWSVASTSTGTGQLAYVAAYRWTIVHSFYNSTERVSVLYHNPDLNSHILFYAKTFVVNGTALSLNSTVLLDTVNSNAECFVEGEICNAVISGATDENGTKLFAAYSWDDSINDSWYIAMKISSDGGQTWAYSGGYATPGYKIDPTPITMTQLDSGKMLMAFTTYQQHSMNYSIYNGSTWSSSPGTITGLGWADNSTKQISSFTLDKLTANSTIGIAYVALVSGGTSGSLKVASFFGNGTLKAVETADNTLSHSLPSVQVTPDGIVHVFSLAGGKIYDTQRNATGWRAPSLPYGNSFDTPDRLTAQANSFAAVLWQSGPSWPHTLRYDATLGHVIGNVNFKISPSVGESYEGERRILRVSNSTLFAFYYDGSNVNYKVSTSNGYSWSIPVSLQTGKINSDYYRWTIASTQLSGSKYVAVLYFKQSSGNTEFYAKRGTITGATISWDTATLLFSAVNNSECNSGVCAAAVAATDSSGNIYASFRWLPSGSSTYKYQILKSANGGSSWTTSLSTTDSSSMARPSMTLTKLASGKMLFVYAHYASGELSYKVFDGTSWSTKQDTSGAGMTLNVDKQISSDSNSTGFAFVAYVKGGTSGNFTIARFSNTTGSPQEFETVDGTQSHSLPSISADPQNHVELYSISGGKVVHMIRHNDFVYSKVKSTYGDAYYNPDQLTTAVGYSGAIWGEGTNSYYYLRHNGIIHIPYIFDICPLLQPATTGNHCNQDNAILSKFGYTAPAFAEAGYDCVGGGKCFKGLFDLRKPGSIGIGFSAQDNGGTYVITSGNLGHTGFIHTDSGDIGRGSPVALQVNQVLCNSPIFWYNAVDYTGAVLPIQVDYSILIDFGIGGC